MWFQKKDSTGVYWLRQWMGSCKTSCKEDSCTSNILFCIFNLKNAGYV
jgi:hypothetical protein